MNIKKITGMLLALAMSFCAAAELTPVVSSAESGSEREGSVFTDRNGFVMAYDEDGDQFVCGYVGAGGAITLPPDAVYVSESAFEGNRKITGLTIPKTCWNCIEERAFAGCVNLKKVVFEGDIEYIGKQAFFGCINLQTVFFKGDVSESYYYGRYDGGGIMEEAFFGCRSLTSVKFKKSKSKLSLISTNAFSNCLSLETLKIPDNTPTIYDAFVNCPKLLSVEIPLKTMIDKRSFGYLKDYAGYDDDPLIRANGKTTVSAPYFYYDSSSGTLKNTYVNITPKAAVLSVVYGSDAERTAERYKMKHISRLPAPANLAALGNNNSILLMWNTVYGADAYRVYRYNYSTKRYVKCADVKKPEYTFNKVEKDTTYKFMVVPLKKVNGKYAEGLQSKPAKFSSSHT